MSDIEKIGWLKERLQQPLPGLSGQERMAARVVPMPLQIPGNAKLSAVLCLLFPVAGELNVLLMKRMADKGAHSGQISFPGGRHEPSDKTLQETALREAWEEVGVKENSLSVLGALTPLYIPVSNFIVHPFVAFSESAPELSLNNAEVVHTLQIPLNVLFHASRKTVTDVISPAVPGIIRKVNAYVLEDGTIIWGATAMIISELETILEEY